MCGGGGGGEADKYFHVRVILLSKLYPYILKCLDTSIFPPFSQRGTFFVFSSLVPLRGKLLELHQPSL